MALSSHNTHRSSGLDATLQLMKQRIRKAVHLATVGIALVTAGLVAPVAGLAADEGFRPPTANERSIAMTESKEAPGGVLAGRQPDWAPTANERSTTLIESKEAPGGLLATGNAT